MKLLPLLLLCSIAHADPAVCFSPRGHCVDLVTAAIAGARKSVLVQAYGFSSRPIELALAAAEKRGVDVQIIVDRSNLHERYSGAPVEVAAGVPVYVDSAHPIAHAKIMIVDDAEVLCGSYNWTRQAERNSEDLVILRGPVAAQFRANWERHRAHSRRWKDGQGEEGRGGR